MSLCSITFSVLQDFLESLLKNLSISSEDLFLVSGRPFIMKSVPESASNTLVQKAN